MLKKILMLCHLPLMVFATEFAPWYDYSLEIKTRADYIYQTFNKVERPHHRNFSYHANDHFLHLSASIPYDVYAGEIEVTCADTKHRKFGFDNLSLTARYQISDDIIGDYFSLVVGATGTQAIKQSVHDLSSFHHGKLEGLLHMSIGKEYSKERFWLYRFWGMVGLGSADVGSPWIESIIAVDCNYWDIHQLRGFVKGMYGFGRDNIHKHDFDGYGPIAHRSIDLGINYCYFTGARGQIKLGYSYRILSRNFPKNPNKFLLSYNYLFGLGF